MASRTFAVYCSFLPLRFRRTAAGSLRPSPDSDGRQGSQFYLTPMIARGGRINCQSSCPSPCPLVPFSLIRFLHLGFFRFTLSKYPPPNEFTDDHRPYSGSDSRIELYTCNWKLTRDR